MNYSEGFQNENSFNSKEIKYIIVDGFFLYFSFIEIARTYPISVSTE